MHLISQRLVLYAVLIDLNLHIIINNFNKQVYENRELLLCINLDKKDIVMSSIEKYKSNNNIKIITLDSKYTLDIV